MMAVSAFAQKGDWYTLTTGAVPVCHIKIDDDDLAVENAGTPSREIKLAGAGGKGKADAMQHIDVKKISANGRFYMILLSEDNLYFCTTFKYFKDRDSLLMYCADGVDDGYKTMQEALNAIKKDTGSHFSITLYRREQLDVQKRKTPISKVTEEDFSAGLTRFSQQMDQFWQFRGYGRYEPFYLWMGLIYGNAFGNAFNEGYSTLSLDAKNLKVPINKYGGNPTIKKQIEDAGLAGTGNQ